MKDCVTIKSYKSGLSLILDKEAPFEEILRALEDKLSKSKDFFRGASVAIAIAGRSLNDGELVQIVSQIEEAGMDVLCVTDPNEEEAARLQEALAYNKSREVRGDGLYLSGDVQSGKLVTSNRSLVILGNVKQGGVIEAAGDIIVIGGLYGTAKTTDESSMVAALDMNPEQLLIADYHVPVRSKKLSRRHRPAQARIISGSPEISEWKCTEGFGEESR